MSDRVNRVLVYGGRDFADEQKVRDVLHALRQKGAEFLLIQGGASGADMLARNWAIGNGEPCCTFHAPWGALGKSAGPIRNRWMQEYGRPTFAVEFPGGRGTADMRSILEAHSVEIWKP